MNALTPEEEKKLKEKSVGIIFGGVIPTILTIISCIYIYMAQTAELNLFDILALFIGMVILSYTLLLIGYMVGTVIKDFNKVRKEQGLIPAILTFLLIFAFIWLYLKD